MKEGDSPMLCSETKKDCVIRQVDGIWLCINCQRVISAKIPSYAELYAKLEQISKMLGSDIHTKTMIKKELDKVLDAKDAKA